jgi:hypothetical protein
MELKDKTILVVSPQRWGKMHVAKHHYAIELAKRGNQVIFLNPPDEGIKEAFKWDKDTGIEGLRVLTYRPYFSLNLRFHLRLVYDLLMYRQVRRLVQFLKQPLDIVWCFEPNLYSNLGWFKAKFNIYHPVDELFYDYQIKVGHSAHLILSVTHEILSKFAHLVAPKQFIHHGLAEEFVHAQTVLKTYPHEGPIKVGYTGNLLRQDIDIPVFTQIIQENPAVEFHLWGAYQAQSSNFGGDLHADNARFIEFLQQAPNVVLHGMVSPSVLATAIQDMDAFLICYDIDKDQSKGTNYHKIMEYLSTGKVIVSNNVSAYKDKPDLIQMVVERKNNEKILPLLKKIINNLETYNSIKSQNIRIEFALGNKYLNNLLKINEIISRKTRKQ